MVSFFETIPPWKMPDNEILQDHRYNVKLIFESNKTDQYTITSDLTNQYKWAEDNGIFMEHNVLRQLKNDRLQIMFVFESIEDAFAFRLRWV